MANETTRKLSAFDWEGKENWKREAVEERIAACELQLATAKEEVKSLQATHYELREILNTTSHIMSSLPLDILTEVFSIACQKDTPVDYGSPPVQFLIGAVCRGWRRTAWSTPRLWSSIYISFSQSRYAAQEDLFRAWIERTGSCTLCLYLSVSYSTSLLWEPPRAFFKMMLKTCDRWTSFIYTHPSTGFPAALRRGQNLKFPSLKTLHVQGYSESPLDQDKWFFNFPPQLRELTVRGQRKFDLGLYWSSLTHLSATFDLLGCLSVLSLSNSLHKLSLSVLASLPITVNGNRSYRPLHLASLEIDGGTTTVGTLLRSMTIPTLKELNIDMYDDTTNYPWIGDLTEMARRSNFQLTNLTIKQATTSHENRILDILSEIPSIEHFELDCSDLSTFSLSDHTVNQLNPALQQSRYNRREFLPKLVTFKYLGNISFSLGCLETMLNQRLLDTNTQEPPLGPFHGVHANSSTTVDNTRKILQVDIIYRNILWHRNQNPNELQAFCRKFTEFHSRGVAFDLKWVENDDGD